MWKTLTAIRLEHGGDLFSARAVDDFVVEDEIRNFWLSGMFYDFDESMWMGRRKKKGQSQDHEAIFSVWEGFGGENVKQLSKPKAWAFTYKKSSSSGDQFLRLHVRH